MIFLVIASLAFHVLVPLALMAWLAFGRPPSVAHYLFRGLLSIAFTLQIAVAGAAWTWFGFWMRYAAMWGVIACTLIGALLAVKRKLTTLQIATWRQRIGLILSVGVFVVFATGLPQLAGRRQFEGTPVELAFPLRGEGFVPVHGGATALVNMHADVKAQRYALDLVQLGAFGMRAKGLLPSALDHYVIYWHPVLAPCSGEVIMAQDDLPDQTPPEGDGQHLAGNHVVIFCQDTSVLLAHLRPHSLKVKVGDQVAMGAHIGDVGNSGNTTEPHLHIHGVRGRVKDETELVKDGEPAPLMFPPHRFPTRNDRIDNP